MVVEIDKTSFLAESLPHPAKLQAMKGFMGASKNAVSLCERYLVGRFNFCNLSRVFAQNLHSMCIVLQNNTNGTIPS